jgi:hypothetical protein
MPQLERKMKDGEIFKGAINNKIQVIQHNKPDQNQTHLQPVTIKHSSTTFFVHK